MLVYIPLQGHYQEAVPGITMDMRSTEWGVEHSMLHHQGHTIVKVKFVFIMAMDILHIVQKHLQT